MRRPVGWLLVVLGTLVAVAGLATAVVFGPDDQVSSGPHSFRSAGAAITTAPAALSYSGPTVEVTASAPGRRVFVGVANDVDVRDYLGATAYTRIDDIDIPWSATTSVVPGDGKPEAAPDDLDMWITSSSGDGRASIRFGVPSTAVDLIVMDADLAPGLDADLTLAVGQDGVFLSGLGVLVCGLGVALFGWLWKRSAPLPPGRGRRRGTRSTARQGAGRRRREPESVEAQT